MARPSFTRPAARYKPQATVLVICEDSKSCKLYLQDAAQAARANVAVEIIHIGTDPLKIVNEAVERKAKFDQIYCVIDRDTHETFANAQALAAKHAGKITPIVSYPCFEFWLLLHFGYTRKVYRGKGKKSPAEELIGDLRKKEGMQEYEKAHSIFAVLGPAKLDAARKHAPSVLSDAEISKEYNPSTTLHLLLNEFDKLGTIQPLA